MALFTKKGKTLTLFFSATSSYTNTWGSACMYVYLPNLQRFDFIEQSSRCTRMSWLWAMNASQEGARARARYSQHLPAAIVTGDHRYICIIAMVTQPIICIMFVQYIGTLTHLFSREILWIWLHRWQPHLTRGSSSLPPTIHKTWYICNYGLTSWTQISNFAQVNRNCAQLAYYMQ